MQRMAVWRPPHRTGPCIRAAAGLENGADARPRARNSSRRRRNPDGTKLYFISSFTRQMVKRPAVGAEGLVLDHYSRDALATHLKAGRRQAHGRVGKNVPYAVFSDSLEVYNADWTAELSGRVPQAPRLRPHALPPRARRRHRREDRVHPARLGKDAQRTGRRQLPDAAAGMGEGSTAHDCDRRPTASRP